MGIEIIIAVAAISWIAAGILGAGKWKYWQIKINPIPKTNVMIHLWYIAFTLAGLVTYLAVGIMEQKRGKKFPWRSIFNFS